MKRFYPLLIFTFLLQPVLFSQTGTIKIAKPTPKPQQTPPPQPVKRQRHFAIEIHAGANYTFKNNSKIGYQAGIELMFAISRTNRLALRLGPGYCVEQQYFQLSAYDNKTKLPEAAFAKSQNNSTYLKIPVCLLYRMDVGPNASVVTSIGLKPEYLLTTKDEHQQLGMADFNRYNLSWTASLGFIIKTHFILSAEYSNDLFENLKDRNIYDANGTSVGTQKSKTKLLSLSLYYGF